MSKKELEKYYNSMIESNKNDSIAAGVYWIKKQRAINGADWYKAYNLFDGALQ